MKVFVALALLAVSISPGSAWADCSDASIARISRKIKLLNPDFLDLRVKKYATAIERASRQYRIPESLLISIAQQESHYNEFLPEGAAGELGLCQIRKMWVHNSLFKREFPKATEADLFVPGRAFLFAAWILKGLQPIQDDRLTSIPYWARYNSELYENRYRYYVSVNHYLLKLSKFEAEGDAAQCGMPQTKAIASAANPPRRSPASVAPARAVMAATAVAKRNHATATRKKIRIAIVSAVAPVSKPRHYKAVAQRTFVHRAKVVRVQHRAEESAAHIAKRMQELPPCRFDLPDSRSKSSPVAVSLGALGECNGIEFAAQGTAAPID